MLNIHKPYPIAHEYKKCSSIFRVKKYVYLFFIFQLIQLYLSCIAVEKAQAQIVKEREAIDMVIVMDRSGSMKNRDPEGLSIPSAAFILDQLSLMNEQNNAAVITFNNDASILGQNNNTPKSALTNNISGLIEMLEAGQSQGNFTFNENIPEEPVKFLELLRSQLNEKGYTELDEALKLAEVILESGNANKRKIILLISDGVPEVYHNDPQNIDSFGVFADIKLLNRIKKQVNLGRDLQQLNQMYSQYILENTAVQLRDKNITILPIAFLPLDQHDKEALPLIEYLKQLRQITSGDTEFPQANSTTLIKKLMGNIPTDSSYIIIHKLIDDESLVKSKEQLRQKERSFIIPEFAEQVRFFFSFPGIIKDQKVHIEIFKDNVKMADSGDSSFPNTLSITQKRRNETVVFHSFRFYTNKIAGSWSVKLTDISKAQTGLLPEIDCLVDIKAQLDLEIETSASGEALRADDPFDLRFKLIGKKEDTLYSIPLTRIDAFLLGRQPENISQYSDRIKNFTYGNIAIASGQKIQNPGIYLLKGWVYFQVDPQAKNPLRLYFEKNYQVKTAVPIDAWFSNQISQDRIPEGKLELPSIGEESEARFSDLLIRTSSNGNVSGLTIISEPLIHNELSIALDESWMITEPATIRGVSSSKPLPFSIIVKLPRVIPNSIPDGLYRTTIILKNGVEVLDSLDVYVQVVIPRFIQSKKESIKLFENESDNPEIIIEKRIYYPGDSTHLFKIPIWSSSKADVRAFPFLMMPQGVEFSPNDTIYTAKSRNNNIIYTLSTNEFVLSGRNSNEPGVVKAEVTLKDESLNNKSYFNTLTLNGEQHRARNIKLITHISFIQKKYIFMGALSILAISCFVLFKSIYLWSRKNCFEGYTDTVDEDNWDIKHGKQILGTFERRLIENNPLANNTLYFQPTLLNSEWLPSGADDWKNIAKNHPLNLQDTLKLTTGKAAFQIVIDAVPEDKVNPEFVYRIEQSPYGRGTQRFYYLCFGLILLAAAVWIFIEPYSLFRLMNI